MATWQEVLIQQASCFTMLGVGILIIAKADITNIAAVKFEIKLTMELCLRPMPGDFHSHSLFDISAIVIL